MRCRVVFEAIGRLDSARADERAELRFGRSHFGGQLLVDHGRGSAARRSRRCLRCRRSRTRDRSTRSPPACGRRGHSCHPVAEGAGADVGELRAGASCTPRDGAQRRQSVRAAGVRAVLDDREHIPVPVERDRRHAFALDFHGLAVTSTGAPRNRAPRSGCCLSRPPTGSRRSRPRRRSVPSARRRQTPVKRLQRRRRRAVLEHLVFRHDGHVHVAGGVRRDLHDRGHGRGRCRTPALRTTFTNAPVFGS